MNTRTWKEQEQVRREDAVANGVITAVIFIVLIVTLAMILMAPTAARADEASRKWTVEDTALQATTLALLAVDRAQTAYASQRRGQYAEIGLMGSALGDRPTVRQTNQYFAACVLVHTAISYALPKPYRTIWQSFWIGAEADAIRTNLSAGISVRF